MATEASIEVGLNNGSALPDAVAALQRTRAHHAFALNAMKTAAYASGRSLAQASSASGSVFGRDTSKVEQTVRAREAFHSRVDAEAEKYRAAYLATAMNSRAAGVNALRAAMNSKGAAREAAIQKASMHSDSAEALERAAEKVESVRQNVGEPDVVSSATARRHAADAGVAVDRSNAVSTTGGSFFTSGTSNVASIMPEFFPAEVQRAAAALSGLGETAPADWWGAVKQSLGMGAAQVSAEAIRVGQEETKSDPAAGALVAGIGGALQAAGNALGLSFNAGSGGKAPPGESSFPVVPVVVVSLGLVGLFVWSRS